MHPVFGWRRFWLFVGVACLIGGATTAAAASGLLRDSAPPPHHAAPTAVHVTPTAVPPPPGVLPAPTLPGGGATAGPAPAQAVTPEVSSAAPAVPIRTSAPPASPPPCAVPVAARVVVQGPRGTVWVAPVPPTGNGAPFVSFSIRVTVETAAGAPLRCLTEATAAGPVKVADALGALNACQLAPHPGCLWIDQGISSWTVEGPGLMSPSPVTVRVETVGGPVVERVPVQVRIGTPPRGTA